MASRFDRRDPGQDPDYCNGLGRTPSLLPETVLCAYCSRETPAPPIRSSHPMCVTCRVARLAPATTQTASAA